ncbi:hypothetical protein [Rhizobium leguminosarum]
MTKEQQFENFWKCYPRRVAKGAARKAFEKAIKKATLEDMIKAISEYVAKKPEKIDFKHPATWLNGECWDDEWEPAQSRAPMPHQETREEYLARAIQRNNEAWEPSSDRRVSNIIRMATAK